MKVVINMRNGLGTIAFVMILISTPKLMAQNVPVDPCENLATLSVATARAVLKTSTDQQIISSKTECVAASIDRLGERGDAQDIPLLISYLGFARPSKSQDPTLPTMHPVAPEDGYPAIAALSQRGELARAPLIAFIGKEADSVKRHNATFALLKIKSADPATTIIQLKEKGRGAQSDVASRFEDAITFAKTTWPCKRNSISCEKASSDK